jgi:hypothetical protein
MSLASNADRQAKIYYRVKELAQENKVTEVADEIEDWGSDFNYYDVYTENPERFVQDNGFTPSLPFSNSRRKYFKDRGFNFHRDGSVTYEKLKK